MPGADLSRYRDLGCFSSSGAAWRERALCAGRGPRLWYSRSRTEQARAVEICWACPVRRACLAMALEAEGGDARTAAGIFGGLTAPERRRLRRGPRTTAVELPRRDSARSAVPVAR